MTKELCGVGTKNGPCTLPKGHTMKYHRHRRYTTITWTIETPNAVALESGRGRVELNYAIARCMEENKSVTIHLHEWNSGDTANGSPG